VQLSDDTFSVTCGGCPSYSTDSDGTFAVTGEGGEPFFLTDIQPDTTKGGVIVFDAPKKVLNKKLELRVNELGFGESHGFIQLPLWPGTVQPTASRVSARCPARFLVLTARMPRVARASLDSVFHASKDPQAVREQPSDGLHVLL
jgi:hypothetical protein